MAEALRADRQGFNARFEAARRSSTLDPGAFSSHLATVVRPLVDAAEATTPGVAPAVTAALFDVSLELLVVAPEGARAVWRELLPHLGWALAAQPRRLAASTTNAVMALDRAGARPAEWVDRMRACAEATDDVDVLLDAGRVAGWRSGLAATRARALDLAGRLPPDLAAAALGLPGVDPAVLDDLAALRWGPVDAPIDVGRVGGFRGFGGPFLVPPTVALEADRLVVTAGTDRWQLHADRFGATLARTAGPTHPPAPPPPLDLPELSGASSWAATTDTVAVTSPLSHHLRLVALPT